MAGSITASGLVSNIDTASIVDQLVSLESRPITLLKNRQTAFRSQVTLLGDIMSRLSALETAARNLGTTGVLAAKVASTNDAFTATPGTGALGGRYAVRVDQLAQAAKWRSAGFDAPTSGVAGGTLSITVKGQTYPAAAPDGPGPIAITDGMSLADVAYAIRQSGAPVSATVVTGWDTLANKAVSYLSVTARDTGFTPADGAASALAISFTADPGATGVDPAFAETQAAQNALFNVDGVDFVRESNTVTDALQGVTLALRKGATAPALTGTVEDLVLNTDADATRAKLQTFVDAYNGVMSMVQRQLNVTKETDRASTLAGDSAVRALQGRLQSILTNQVSGLAGVSRLSDLGVKTGKDGSLSIDSTLYAAALARDPAAIDALFSTATTGLGDYVSAVVQAQVGSIDGVLVNRQKGLNSRITAMDGQMAAMQRRVDAFKVNLQKQFLAMENTLSNLKSTGNFLQAQLSQMSTSSG
jgi:flagellar hook-associated protein 2